MGWKCKNCGFDMPSSDWQSHVVKRQGGLLGGKVWYACPRCGKTVELNVW